MARINKCALFLPPSWTTCINPHGRDTQSKIGNGAQSPPSPKLNTWIRPCCQGQSWTHDLYCMSVIHSIIYTSPWLICHYCVTILNTSSSLMSATRHLRKDRPRLVDCRLTHRKGNVIVRSIPVVISWSSAKNFLLHQDRSTLRQKCRDWNTCKISTAELRYNIVYKSVKFSMLYPRYYISDTVAHHITWDGTLRYLITKDSS